VHHRRHGSATGAAYIDRVRRRILGVAVLAVVLAVLLFGVPLALAAARLFTDDEHSELERIALRTGVNVPSDLSSGRASITFPDTEPGVRVGVYGPDGRRVVGRGPVDGGRSVDSSLRGRVVESKSATELVVVVPITSTDGVVAVVRASSPRVELRNRVRLTWAAMAGLALLAGVCASFFAAVQSRRLTRPLQRLESVAEDLGAGNFSSRAEPSGVGEIDRTGQALNRTAQRLDDLLARERAFSAQASHQLRTPLTRLRLVLETALETDGDVREAAREAIGSADQLSRTVDDVLALSRGVADEGVLLDLTVLLAGLRTRWEGPLAADDRRLVVDEQPHPSTVSSEAAVRQILEVLVDNAYRHGRGQVTVTARDGGGALAVDVADEGHVPAGRHLLPTPDGEPAPAAAGGRRLGLPMAASLAEGIGGRLLHASTEPRTRLTLLLAPRDDA
jgi:signal transduction histidine kinase